MLPDAARRAAGGMPWGAVSPGCSGCSKSSLPEAQLDVYGIDFGVIGNLHQLLPLGSQSVATD